MDQNNDIKQMLSFCRELGTHVQENRDGNSFTAMLWEDTDSISEDTAAKIQRKIKQKTAIYPGIVCYCFDVFSTLIYRV